MNMCVETKKWMDTKDDGGASAEESARKKLLSFYDIVTAHQDFNDVCKDDFRVLEDRVRGERKCKKKPDVSGLSRFKSLGPLPKRPAAPSTVTG